MILLLLLLMRRRDLSGYMQRRPTGPTIEPAAAIRPFVTFAPARTSSEAKRRRLAKQVNRIL